MGPNARIFNLEKRIKELEELNIETIKQKEEQEKQKKEEFTLAQQMLILNYLELIKGIKLPNTRKSLLLSKLLGKNKDNIKDILTYISSPRIAHSVIKNEENLEVMIALFTKLKMPEIVDNINVDLSKVRVNIKLKSLQPPLQ